MSSGEEKETTTTTTTKKQTGIQAINFFVGQYEISLIKGKFRVFSLANQRQGNVQKSVLYVQSCVLLIRLIVSLICCSRCRRCLA